MVNDIYMGKTWLALVAFLFHMFVLFTPLIVLGNKQFFFIKRSMSLLGFSAPRGLSTFFCSKIDEKAPLRVSTKNHLWHKLKLKKKKNWTQFMSFSLTHKSFVDFLKKVMKNPQKYSEDKSSTSPSLTPPLHRHGQASPSFTTPQRMPTLGWPTSPTKHPLELLVYMTLREQFRGKNPESHNSEGTIQRKKSQEPTTLRAPRPKLQGTKMTTNLQKKFMRINFCGEIFWGENSPTPRPSLALPHHGHALPSLTIAKPHRKFIWSRDFWGIWTKGSRELHQLEWGVSCLKIIFKILNKWLGECKGSSHPSQDWIEKLPHKDLFAQVQRWRPQTTPSLAAGEVGITSSNSGNILGDNSFALNQKISPSGNIAKALSRD